MLPPDIELGEGFGDIETLFNSRKWLECALHEKGAKLIGGGVGCGQADVSIILDGCHFTVSIAPVLEIKNGKENQNSPDTTPNETGVEIRKESKTSSLSYFRENRTCVQQATKEPKE
jgi:hypothetical protein